MCQIVYTIKYNNKTYAIPFGTFPPSVMIPLILKKWFRINKKKTITSYSKSENQ